MYWRSTFYTFFGNFLLIHAPTCVISPKQIRKDLILLPQDRIVYNRAEINIAPSNQILKISAL
jgi:hypothetical protein